MTNSRELQKLKTSAFFVIILSAHARCHPEGGCNGGEYGDYDVQDFTPDFLAHDLLNDS